MDSVVHIEEDVQLRSDAGWDYKFLVQNQNFIVMSIAECKPIPAIKIFGVYNHQEEAENAAAKISRENDFFNVYVADTNAWFPIPPTADFIQDVQYQEKRMMEIKNSFKTLKETNAKNLAQKIKNSTNTCNVDTSDPAQLP